MLRAYWIFVCILILQNMYAIDKYDMHFDYECFDTDLQEPIFVSLGSTCEVAHHLRALNLRKTAFPFDWILTVDSDGFLKILEDTFHHYWDESFLEPHSNGIILNSYYKVAYPYEGYWKSLSEPEYHTALEKFQSKYQRRAKRFLSLSNYRGKVFFIRASYTHAHNNPYFRDTKTSWIEDEWAILLHRTLQNLFPHLDFHLAIVNLHSNGTARQVRHIHNDITVFECNLYIEGTENKKNQYKQIYSQLLIDQGLKNSETFQDLKNNNTQ